MQALIPHDDDSASTHAEFAPIGSRAHRRGQRVVLILTSVNAVLLAGVLFALRSHDDPTDLLIHSAWVLSAAAVVLLIGAIAWRTAAAIVAGLVGMSLGLIWCGWMIAELYTL